MNEDYTMQETAANPFSNFSLSGVLNGSTLNKAIDTALDVYAIRETGKALGSVYPTGQVNPAAVQSQNATAKPAMNYTPYIIGGAALVGVVILVAVLRK